MGRSEREIFSGLGGMTIILISLFLPYLVFLSGFDLLLLELSSLFESNSGSAASDYEFEDGDSEIDGKSAFSILLLSITAFIIPTMPLINMIIVILSVFLLIIGRGTLWAGILQVNVYFFFIILSLSADLTYSLPLLYIPQYGFWIALLGGILLCFGGNKGFSKSKNNKKFIDDSKFDEYENVYDTFRSSISKVTNVKEIDDSRWTRPEYNRRGDINDDGWEVIEYPKGSGNWWWKDYENLTWEKWD